MKKNKVLVFTVGAILLGGFTLLKAQQFAQNRILQDEIQQIQTKRIIYFNPEIQPDIEEIIAPTSYAFFSTISNQFIDNKNTFLKIEQTIPFDENNSEVIQEYCKNNQADFAVVPKIKYFKVGLGKFVFSSQVVVSMKLYNSNGDLLSETQYDTYKKSKKLLGSAENFVKIGTKGAWKEILKSIKSNKNSISPI